MQSDRTGQPILKGLIRRTLQPRYVDGIAGVEFTRERGKADSG